MPLAQPVGPDVTSDILSVDGLSLSFGGLSALTDVHFTVRRG